MISILNSMSGTWWNWMGPMFLQVSVLILIITVLDWGGRKWIWPQVRYALWILVLVKLLIPPSWSLPSAILPRIQSKALYHLQQVSGYAATEAPVESDQQAVQPGSTPGVPSGTVYIGREIPPEPSGNIRTSGLTWQAYAFIMWISGMILFMVLLFMKIRKLRRWHQEQEERKTIPPWFHEILVRTAEHLKLDHLPSIVFHDRAVSPAVYGVIRPVLLLPAGYFNKLTHEEAENVLLHELAHLKRGDLWVHGLTLFLQIVYWFNPLLLWVRRQTRHVIELCCDLTIANILKEKTGKYRQTLLDTARELLTESLEPGMGLLGVFEEPFRLVTRLKWLEKKTWLTRKWMFVTVFGVLLFMVPCILPMAEKTTAFPSGPLERKGNYDDMNKAMASPDKAVYIMEVTREKTYFLEKETRSAIISIEDIWVQGKRISITEGQNERTFVVDAEQNTFTLIDHRDDSYVKVNCPLDNSLLEPGLRRKQVDIHTTGSVRETRKTMDICGIPNKEFQVKSFIYQDTKKINRQEFKVWVAADVPFDLEAYTLFLKTLRILYNRDEPYQEELLKMKGYQMGEELNTSRFPWKKKYTKQVTEISEKELPGGIFQVPAGYTEKIRFDVDDIR